MRSANRMTAAVFVWVALYSFSTMAAEVASCDSPTGMKTGDAPVMAAAM